MHMKHLRPICIGLLMSVSLYGQSVGIGTAAPNASARLDVTSTNQGVLLPRVALTSLTDATTIPSPATSLLVYNTNTALPYGAGYYYNAGTPAAPRWMPLQGGETVWYHVSSTTNAISLNTNNTYTALPGMSQTIVVPTGFVADVEIWAQAMVGIGGGNSTSWAVADLIVYRNGNFIPVGGWNRRKLDNAVGTVADIDALVIIARETLPAGTYTYELRGNRTNGNVAISVGGNCNIEVNCAELKLAVRYRPQ